MFLEEKKNFYKRDLISNIFLWTYTLNTPKKMSYKGQKKKKSEDYKKRNINIWNECLVHFIK